MATSKSNVGAAPYCMFITFEIVPGDEAEFNDIYDNDHLPTILKHPDVLEIVRFKDAEPNDRGYLVYSALYMFARENVHLTPEWTALSDLGRWAPVIRPKIKSRARRAGPVVARFKRSAS
jgi:hypothetical protein